MFQKIRQSLSVLLVLAFVVQLVPVQCFSAETDVFVDNTSESDIIMTEDVSASADVEEVLSAQVVGEDVSRRDEFYKEFVLDNGLRLASVYPEAVHFEKDGAWEDIDNTLVAATRDGVAGYSNTAGIWSVHFPAQLSGSNVISVTKDGYTVSFGMAGALRSDGGLVVASIENELGTQAVGGSSTLTAATAQLSTAQIQAVDTSAMKAGLEHPEIVSDKLYSRLSYPTVYSGTNVVYDLSGNRLKESVILSAYDDGLWGYRYSLDTGDLVAVLNEDQSIDLVDAGGEVVLHMPAPFLVDDAGEYCDDIDVALTQNGDGYTLAYYLPRTWLADGDRAWPVVLDPVIYPTSTISNLQDITISENSTYDTNYDLVYCGYESTNGILRTYLRYKSLPYLSSSQVIVDATVHLTAVSDDPTATLIEVHKVTEAWNSSTTSYTWDTAPAFDSIIEDRNGTGRAGVYSWNVTDIVRGWYSDGNALTSGTGMLFKATTEIETGGTENYSIFKSSDHDSGADLPYLTFKYIDISGLESYWQTSSSSVGRAGTGYVDHYSGNLVWTHNDMGFDGLLMPVSIQHIYNSGSAYTSETNASTNPFGVGNGWRTNYHQTVYGAADENDDSYYIWEDGDGTKHDLIYDSSLGGYADVDGLDVLLTFSGSTRILTDRYGNTSQFDPNGRLVKLENYQQKKSSITITYVESTKKIQQIVDGVGRKYVFTYDTSGLLSNISFYGTGTTVLAYVDYAYSADGDLTSITYADDKSVTYTYGSKNLLTCVTGVDGSQIRYSYYNTGLSGKPSRVQTVQEYDGSVGAQLTFNYYGSSTKVTDHEGRVQILYFNEWGNVISSYDDEGIGQVVHYTTEEDASSTRNRVSLVSQQFDPIRNPLKDISFEKGTEWSVLASGTTVENVTSISYLGEHSLMVKGQLSGNFGAYSDSVPVCAGESVTFSAYVKCTLGAASIQIVDEVGDAVSSGSVSSAVGGWTRLEVTYTNTSSESRSIQARIYGQSSGYEVYMDCVQVEFAEAASRFNLVENGDFVWNVGETDSNWSLSGSTPTCDHGYVPPNLFSRRLRIDGKYGERQYASQTVKVKGSVGDVYTVSGWAMGELAYRRSVSYFTGIRVQFKNDSGAVVSSAMIPVSNDLCKGDGTSTGYQFIADQVVATADYTSITVFVEHNYSPNTVYFDGISLYKERFGTEYEYDANGNMSKSTDILGQSTSYSYPNGVDLTTVTPPVGPTTTYNYDGYHNVTKKTESVSNVATSVTTYTYNAYGNNTSTATTSGSVTKTTSTTYTSSNNYVYKVTDNEGGVSQYNYDEQTGTLLWYRTPEDDWTSQYAYDYDELYRMVYASEGLITSDTDRMCVQYIYTDDQLTRISRPGTDYYFTYGDFGLVTKVGFGTKTMVQYVYSDDGDHALTKLYYGISKLNSDRVEYAYDEQGRVITETYYENGGADGTHTVSYTYDKKGDLVSTKDTSTGITTRYYYDDFGRLVLYSESGGDVYHALAYGYDAYGRLSQQKETIGSSSRTTSYTYDSKGRLTKTTQGIVVTTYTYDDLDRLVTKKVCDDSDEIEVETYTYSSKSDRVTSVSKSGINYTYGYDKNGDIISVNDGAYTTTYAYDGARQLIRENNQRAGKTWCWTYDPAGNILTKTEHAYTTADTVGTATDTISYAYGYSEWGDRLTKFDGKYFTFDDLGNPLTYGDDVSYTWKNGRQLGTMTMGDETWSFTYDSDGLRLGRTNGTDSYSYLYADGLLTRMVVGSTTMLFYYDGSGRPVAISYGGTMYYYVLDLQGDVMGIRDSSGTLVVRYYYDAWGRLLSTTGSKASTLGVHNPLRYRGYVYDTETGLYYLQSRYYDPEMGRFISADEYLSTGQGVLGINMFAYCRNDPVIYLDTTGNAIETVFDIISLGASIAEVSVNPFDPWAWVGLLGDAADVAIPFVGGLGEAVRALRALDAIDDAVDLVKITQKTLKVISDIATISSFTANTTSFNSVYVSYTDPQQTVLEYVGITNDIGRRKTEWSKTRMIHEKISCLSRTDARCAEQLIISLFGKGGAPNLSNVRNSIGIKGTLVDDYISFFRKFF